MTTQEVTGFKDPSQDLKKTGWLLRHVLSDGMSKSGHGIGWEIGRFMHDCKPLVLKEVEDLRHVVGELVAPVMWLSDTDVLQVLKMAETGERLDVESQLMLVERTKDIVAKQIVNISILPIVQEIE